MALANGLLYRGTLPGNVYAIDATDGSILWTDEVDAGLTSGFSIQDGTLYVPFGTGTPGNMRAPEGGVIAYRHP